MERSLNCIIVEDDPVSQAVLEGLIARTAFLKLQRSFNEPLHAISWLSENTTDLIFLDVELPQLNGFEMLSSLKRKSEVIIISSKDFYGSKAFDHDVTDYLIKPIQDYARFLKAVMKVKEKAAEHPAGAADSIFVKVDSLFTNLSLDEITFVEALGDYVKIVTDKKTHTVYTTMKALEEKLPSRSFIRVHRSFIVNLKKITNIDQSNLQIDSKIIPIGNSYRDQLMRSINLL